jgi:hypothetical protein
VNIYWTAGLIAGACIAAFATVLVKIAAQTAHEINGKMTNALQGRNGVRQTERDERGIRDGAALEVTTV